MENLKHSMCVLLEVLKRMCALLEHHKSDYISFVIQYYCNYSSIPSNQSGIIVILVHIGGEVHYY